MTSSRALPRQTRTALAAAVALSNIHTDDAQFQPGGANICIGLQSVEVTQDKLQNLGWVFIRKSSHHHFSLAPRFIRLLRRSPCGGEPDHLIPAACSFLPVDDISGALLFCLFPQDFLVDLHPIGKDLEAAHDQHVLGPVDNPLSFPQSRPLFRTSQVEKVSYLQGGLCSQVLAVSYMVATTITERNLQRRYSLGCG
ncbi:MAG: hypothetical protein M0P74_05190 [Syntrophales bacterium]|jgi:hypothetical protein|nr:hypothetical protein [Syntrophales bacterium]